MHVFGQYHWVNITRLKSLPFDSGSYVDLLQYMARLTEPSLQMLKARSLLADSQRFFTLTPDITRFILKQQERMQKNTATPSEAPTAAVLLMCCNYLDESHFRS